MYSLREFACSIIANAVAAGSFVAVNDTHAAAAPLRFDNGRASSKHYAREQH
jgi:hypothetical protein